MGSSMVLYAMPEFVLGMIFILIFAVGLHWFPVNLYQSPLPKTGFAHWTDVINHMALPWLTLTLAYVGEFYLVMRSSLLDVLGEEYIALARAKGVREKYVLRKHAVPNALLPTITLVALSFGFILSGVITIEYVFSYPGAGLTLQQAALGSDYPLTQGLLLVFAFCVIGANFIMDLLNFVLDPRVRAS